MLKSVPTVGGLIVATILFFEGPRLSELLVRPSGYVMLREIPELTDLLRERAVDNEIVMTVATSSFEDVLLNLICSLEGLGVQHYIVGALDQPLYDSLRARGFPAFPAYAGSTSGKQMVEPGFTRSREFNRVNLVKQEGVVRILQQGYNVLLTDADVVWRKNPIPYLRHQSSSFDFIFQTSTENEKGLLELNGGFFYVKPSDRAIRTLKWLILQKTKDPLLMDQTPLRFILCSGSKRMARDTCQEPGLGTRSLMLPPMRFLKGKKLLEILKLDHSALETIDPYIVHYTGGKVDGSKKEKMTASNMWLLDDEQTCIMQAIDKQQ